MDHFEVWRLVIRIALFVAALCTTSFPVLYGIISPWHKSWLGRALMLQGVALAAALDITLIFQFWKGANSFRFGVYAVVIIAIAAATATLTAGMWRTNRAARTRRSLMTDNNGIVQAPKPEQKTFPLLSNTTYDRLKPVTTMVLPAVVTFWLLLGDAWHWDDEMVLSVAKTVGGFNVLLGVVLAVATRAYNNSDAKFDGDMNVGQVEGVPTVQLALNEHPDSLQGKDSVTLKVNNQA